MMKITLDLSTVASCFSKNDYIKPHINTKYLSGVSKMFQSFQFIKHENFDTKYCNCSFQIQLQEEIDPIVQFEASSFQFLV